MSRMRAFPRIGRAIMNVTLVSLSGFVLRCDTHASVLEWALDVNAPRQ